MLLLSYLLEIKSLFRHRLPVSQESRQDLVLRDRRWVVIFFFLIVRNELKLLFFWKLD